MGVAADERRALCDLFDEVGPDAPTLCGGWQSRDLAAHLALRDRRPDAAPGILLKPFARYTNRVQDQFAAKPWGELVGLVRTGPPGWSPFAIPALGEIVNGPEYYVHHEDLRRGRPGWEPRPPSPARDATTWAAVGRVGRMAFRRSPVGVVLRRQDGAEATAKRGPTTVTVIGAPGELLLYAFGRTEVQIAYEGDQHAIGVVQGLDRSF
ncbi:MAG TPA: TIGR03085 family metal-binding protein [Pseudonocardiaceae bacterium]|jgi:uncharacterized protein (TIGR03085 family)|nr:TIGR03085 family metal-binding protein [Pseudonocardiaceae bacterium]